MDELVEPKDKQKTSAVVAKLKNGPSGDIEIITHVKHAIVIKREARSSRLRTMKIKMVKLTYVLHPGPNAHLPALSQSSYSFFGPLFLVLALLPSASIHISLVSIKTLLHYTP